MFNILFFFIFYFKIKLPDSDNTPAIQVTLSSVPMNNSNPSASSVMTEINLNDANSQQTAGANNLDTVNLAATAANQNEPIPPLSELPSYNEAIRIKKLEANGDLPPSYFPGGPYDPEQHDHPTRITIDAIDV